MTEITEPQLTLNKTFVSNTIKQVDDHNRMITNYNSTSLRKFQNEERKKQTRKNLHNFSAKKTMYSDFYPPKENTKTSIGATGSKIITPFQQLKKIVIDAAEFDVTAIKEVKRVPTHKRISVDKSLLRNHLKHSSVHNRLKEEEEMWEQHISGKNEAKHSQKFLAGVTGGLYSDREPGRVKAIRVKATPDEPQPAIIGKATFELLELEESIPGRWGHSGFKEVHLNESNFDHHDDNSMRRVIVSNHISSRLNNSIELSDDESEVELLPRSKKRKLISRNAVNPNQNEEAEPLKVHKFSTESRVNKVVCDRTSKHDRDRKGSQRMVTKNRVVMDTLQADLMNAENRSRRNSNRSSSPKWGHDGFHEICVDVGKQNDVKSRLNIVKVSDNDDDELSVESRSRLRNRRKKEKESSIELSIQLSDSDEWTEKEISGSSFQLNHRKGSTTKKGRQDLLASTQTIIIDRQATCKRTSIKNHSDSSPTGSSDDECFSIKSHGKLRNIPYEKKR